MVYNSKFPGNTLSDVIFAEYDDGSKEYRMDVIWYHLNQIKRPIGNNFSFNLLFRVVSIILMIPHSNAGIERGFIHGKQKQKLILCRNHLDQDKVLSCNLAVNLDSPEEMSRCYETKPQKELLYKAKRATIEYNQEHSSKQD